MDISEPTQEEKRIRIAEACGWQETCPSREVEFQFKYFDGKHPVGLMPGGESGYDELPDYFNDLNAMALAESTLLPRCEEADVYRAGDAQRYENCLITALTDEDPYLGADLGDLWHASAAHRAEAFGRAWKLW